MNLAFRIPGEAVSATVRVVRFGNHSAIRKGSAAEAWESRIATAAQEARGPLPLLEGPVAVEVSIRSVCPKGEMRKREPRPERWKTTTPDVDKIARCVLDALTGVLYRDDAQVAELRIEKRVAAQGMPAETTIEIHPLSEGVQTASGQSGQVARQNPERAYMRE